MDIWAWLYRATQDIEAAGHPELASKFFTFPNTAAGHHHDVVDAVYPELLAAARAVGNPWLEVYARHWYSQSLYLRDHADALLRHSVETLEFAHREETEQCPQSVCAVQDLCMAYASCDGPVHVEQRLGVTAEAFARIDASWPCYVCLSAEEAAAHVDAGNLDTALVAVRRRVAAVRAATGKLNAHDSTVLSKWLQAAGDPKGALKMLGAHDTQYVAERRITRALAHLALGDAPAAAEALPTSESARREDEYWRWIGAYHGVVSAGLQANTWEEAAAIHSYVTQLVEHGASWKAFGLVERHLQLAVLRGARCTAEAALALLRAAQAALTDGARVTPRVVAATEAVETIPAPTLPCAPAEAAGVLDAMEGIGPEELLDLADTAAAQGAAGDDLLMLRSRLLAQLGRLPEARALLLTRLEQAPDSPELTAGCLRAFWEDAPSLQRVAEIIAVAQPVRASWTRANLAFRRKDHAETVRHCREILDRDPTAVNTMRLWADACRAMGEYIDELPLRQAVLAHSDPIDPMDRWQLLVPATIWGEWALVREQLPYLDLHPQSDEGPIAEHWGHVTITYPDGRSSDVVAQRTGPVSAIIRGVLPWDDDQCYGDEVVFAPGYLNERPADADDAWRPTFAHVVTVREGKYRTEPVSGPYPGDEAWEAIRAQLGECDLVRTSNDDFRIFDQQRQEHVPAVWSLLLIPPSVTLVEADGLLTAATAHLHDPLFWWELADDAGLDAKVHAVRGKRYGYKYPGG